MREVSSDLVRETFIAFLMIDNGMRETSYNSNPRIDVINKAMGVPPRSSYCLGGLQVAMDATEKKLNIKFKRLRTAGTQKFFDWYAEHHPELIYQIPDRGDVCILRHTEKPAFGHAYCALAPPVDEVVSTFEYNTNAQGSRDGDYSGTSTRKRAGGKTLALRGFVRFWALYEVLPDKAT